MTDVRAARLVSHALLFEAERCIVLLGGYHGNSNTMFTWWVELLTSMGCWATLLVSAAECGSRLTVLMWPTGKWASKLLPRSRRYTFDLCFATSWHIMSWCARGKFAPISSSKQLHGRHLQSGGMNVKCENSSDLHTFFCSPSHLEASQVQRSPAPDLLLLSQH